MKEAEVRQTVCELIRTETGRQGPFPAEAHLTDQLGLDSLELLSLTVALENHFELCLEPDEEHPLESIGDVAALIVRLGEAREEVE